MSYNKQEISIMIWRIGSQIRVATPEGSVYIATNRVHHYNTAGFVGMFTVGPTGKGIIPFIIPSEIMSSDNVSDNLERITIDIDARVLTSLN